MRLERYIKESWYTDDAFGGHEEFSKIMEMIAKDCSEILKFYHRNFFTGTSGDMLSRAVKFSIPTIKKYDTWTDRKPKDMDQETHDLLNKHFLKEHGWKARSEAAFATFGWPGEIYGQTYLFFPFDGYKFLYNPNIADLWAKIPLKIYDGYTNLDDEGKQDRNEKMETWIKNAVKGYTDKNLAGAIAPSSEVMFKVKSYYLVNTRYERSIRDYINNLPR